MAKRIVIVGAGWYGLYLAKILLKKGILDAEITIIDKNRSIFEESSRYNQCRLHLGFHYPRSFETRQLCMDGFFRFINEFPDVSYDIPENSYVISDSSILDYQTYCAIFSHEGYEFDVRNRIGIRHGKGIVVTERGIDPMKAKQHFENELIGRVQFMFAHTVIGCYDKHLELLTENNTKLTVDFDMCYDCSNFQAPIGPQPNVVFEKTITLLYHYRKLECVFGALTVMDGPFFSIFPYDLNQQIYTLTHVKYTIINDTDWTLEKVRAEMENEVIEYYPDFPTDFEYRGFFISPKTKPVSRSDSRHLLISHVSPSITRVSCGKITGIFQMVDTIL